MTILITLDMGDITDNAISYNWFYLEMTLLITVNKSIYISNVTFINVISKVIISKVITSKAIMSKVFISKVIISKVCISMIVSMPIAILVCIRVVDPCVVNYRVLFWQKKFPGQTH